MKLVNLESLTQRVWQVAKQMEQEINQKQVRQIAVQALESYKNQMKLATTKMEAVSIMEQGIETKVTLLKTELKDCTKVFDYEKYCAFMESKKVRHGKDRTYTLVDFISEEQLIEVNKKGIQDLSSFDPTPKLINDYFKFVDNLYINLFEKFPDDAFLNKLDLEEFQVLKITTNWYEKYGFKYDEQKLLELKNINYEDIILIY